MTLWTVVFGLVLAAASVCAGAAGAAGARVSGGEQAVVESHPFVAQLLREEAGAGFQYACAGAILTAFFTLSAASCFHGTDVSAGAWRGRYGSSSSAFGGSVVVIFSVATHPEYSAASLDADVAVARVQVALTYGAAVQPGYFAAPTTQLPDGALLTLLGWGSLDEEGAWSQWLQAAGVVTLGAGECAARRGEAPGARQFCTGVAVEGAGDAAGACSGDVGAPLVVGGVVVGVTAAAGGCGGHGAALNTLVPAVIDWVTEYTQGDH